MSEQMVTVAVSGRIGTITVRRPRALNALNAEVQERLIDAVAELESKPEVRVLMLTGEGDRAFIAGADVGEFVGASPADALAMSARTQSLANALAHCPKPVIAVVNGYCLGGGFELALACDLRIASVKARFGLPEIRLGLIPGGGGTVRLTRIAGSSVARTLSMTGDPVDTARAYALGLLVSVHEPDELAAAAQDLAARIAGFSPFALAQLKSTLNVAADADSEAALQSERKSFALCFSTRDKEEGVCAFLEKRTPEFTGK